MYVASFFYAGADLDEVDCPGVLCGDWLHALPRSQPFYIVSSRIPGL